MSIEPIELGQKLKTYCENFAVPIDYIFDILNDQKVVPMIRGKATEYQGYLEVLRNLSASEWTVQKLNLNAQPGLQDQDIQVTHRRTGMILRVECKSAVRGSMRKGTRSCKVPHFNVKCHRSRSNIRLAGTTNDRYSVDSFDVVVCNVSNALYQGKTFGAELELLHDKDVLYVVSEHYGVSTEKEILEHAYSD
ncbi:MAG: hypothetical protein JW749_07130 [Sedimentisphaerales bacterium]|nr:hypothetical protein [Sedimentisphaerales bacterium]